MKLSRMIQKTWSCLKFLKLVYISENYMLLLFWTHIKDEVWWECLSLALTGTWISRSVTLLNFSTRNNKIFLKALQTLRLKISLLPYMYVFQKIPTLRKNICEAQTMRKIRQNTIFLWPLFSRIRENCRFYPCIRKCRSEKNPVFCYILAICH